MSNCKNCGEKIPKRTPGGHVNRSKQFCDQECYLEYRFENAAEERKPPPKEYVNNSFLAMPAPKR